MVEQIHSDNRDKYAKISIFNLVDTPLDYLLRNILLGILRVFRIILTNTVVFKVKNKKLKMVLCRLLEVSSKYSYLIASITLHYDFFFRYFILYKSYI